MKSLNSSQTLLIIKSLILKLNYEFNQVLALDTEEGATVIPIFKQIEKEQQQLPGTNTRDIVIAQLELLLDYTERYYHIRQLSMANKDENSIFAQLETHIDGYLRSPDLLLKDIPGIKYLSDRLHVSPNHLSRLVQSLTRHITQHFFS